MKQRTMFAAVALLASACAGPVAPLDVGSKEVPLDLLLGARAKRIAEAPVPPLVLTAGPSGFPVVGSPRPRGGPPVEMDPGPCPEMDPLTVPRLVATNTVTSQPKEVTYNYRTKGRYRVGGANAEDILLAPVSTWKIENVTAEPTEGFTFDAAVTNESDVTTTTYRVFPIAGAANVPPIPNAGQSPPSDAPAPNAGVPAGLYLAGVSAEGSLGFRPAYPGIAIVRFPIDLGAMFDASGSDGNTTMSWRSLVRPKQTVDACGEPLDTYTVELTNGRIAQAQSAEILEFTTKMALATQYGGLPVFQSSEVTGTQGGTAPVSRTVEMTINSEPEVP